MLEKIFNSITKISIRFKWITLGLSLILIVAGGFAFTSLNQELIPKVEFPQTIILALGSGQNADEMLEEVTIPIEEAMAAIEGVINVETTTSSGLSVTVVRNDFGDDQEALKREIQKAIRKIEYPEGMNVPEILTFSLSDMPMAAMSVSFEGATLEELKQLVEEEIVPEIEALDDQVGKVSISGGQELPTGADLEALLAGESISDAGDLPYDPEEELLLPQSWIDAYTSQGYPDINTPEILIPRMVSGIVSMAPEMLDDLTPEMIYRMAPEVVYLFPEELFAAFDQEAQDTINSLFFSDDVFVPTETINRADGDPSLGMIIYQTDSANTVNAWHAVDERLNELKADYPGLKFNIVFEQATFIEESISGVTREGGLGAVFAVIIILIFLSGRINGKYKLSWRSTLVTAVSIPLSVMMAFVLFKWLPVITIPIFDPIVKAVSGIAVVEPIVKALASLFTTELTLNIMTLSGMTVAIGRVVDDSIVVLENIYRHIQRGDDRMVSVIKGTRDVSIAIFASTATTVVVFLPIGLMGGLVGVFFLPFGIAVTYALSASFLVAITVVPLLAFMFIRKEHLPVEQESGMQKVYTPVLKWALKNRFMALLIASVLLIGSIGLFSTRPQAFIPDFGDVRIEITVDLPDDYNMAQTDHLTKEFEAGLNSVEGISNILSEVGTTGGMEALFLGATIDQSAASISIGLEDPETALDKTAEIRAIASEIYGDEHVIVSAGSLSSKGFGGFALIASSENFDDLVEFNEAAIETLNSVEGLANVSSNLASASTYLRVDGEPSIAFVGELETSDTLGVTTLAKEALLDITPSSVTVSEGFDSRQQTEGFAQTFQAIGVSVVVVYLVMVLTFHSFVHPFTILFSLPMAIIGAAVAMWLANSVLGISSLVGMMMLVGIVVTNAIVMVDRVIVNQRERGMDVYQALMEAGRTRLRPILMTAMAAILALIPMAIGMNEGAIIASDLAIVVIGGLTTSTLLTLVIVPVMYSVMDRFATNTNDSEFKAE